MGFNLVCNDQSVESEQLFLMLFAHSENKRYVSTEMGIELFYYSLPGTAYT